MAKEKFRILVLGATGMLGSTLYRTFSDDPLFDVYGTIRSEDKLNYFLPKFHSTLIPNIQVESADSLISAFAVARPHLVINCIGIIKQSPAAQDHLASLSINSILPHRLAKNCEAFGARLVHFSTDCVFSGKRGLYTEEDFPDACDIYGRTKLLGEVCYDNSITLRTSIIGHEVNGAKSLVDWFLNQSGSVQGFTKAIFSGLPTIEVARVIKEFVLPNAHLSGLYHVSVDPISKYDLLKIVGEIYNKKDEIIPDDKVVIDRSLNSDRFRRDTGFKPMAWSDLIFRMHKDYLSTR